MEQIDRFLLAVGLLPTERFRAFHKFHVHRNFNLEHVNAITIFAEFAHALGHDVRLLLRVLQALFVSAFVVSNKLQKVWDIIRAALVANTLYPSVLLVIHILRIEWRVVEQDLHTIRASFLQTLRRPVVKQIPQTPWSGLVVSSLFIGKQQSSVPGAPFRCRQSPFRIEQNRTGMWRKDFGHQRLEFFHHGIGDLAALFFRQ